MGPTAPDNSLRFATFLTSDRPLVRTGNVDARAATGPLPGRAGEGGRSSRPTVPLRMLRSQDRGR